MKLPIADCRLPITDSLAGRSFARGCHDGREFVGFVEKCRQFLGRQNAGLNQQFEPQGGFIRLFLDRSHFGDKLGLAAGAATGSIIRGHRSGAAQDLFGDDAPGLVAFWHRPGHFDNAEGKSFGSGFKLGWVHGVKLQFQSAIGNRQSTIRYAI